MPSHLSADRSSAPHPERGVFDALITQTRRLRGEVDAVRRDAVEDDDPQVRWQRALCELAVHQLDDLRAHLGQLRAGLPPEPAENGIPAPAAPPEEHRAGPLSRVGSAEWDLLTDAVHWSDELFEIFDRDPAKGGLTLDELPSYVFTDDQPVLTAMVTACLVDGKPIDGEFRILCPGGGVRTVHMMGEPVLDADGGTASMWAVLRDVSELRRSQRVERETRDSLQRQRHFAQTEHRLAVELQEAVLPPWRGPLRFPNGGPGTLDMAAHYLPSATSALIGGDWYDALELPGGDTLMTVGDLTGHGVTATSGMAMLLGALRGMAVAGLEPGPLMGWLNRLLDASAQPALGSAVCCRYDPRRRLLTWAQAGHPAPLLFRDGTGIPLTPPEGVLLGATSGAVYAQAEVELRAGDVLVLHTDGLSSRSEELTGSGGYGEASVRRLLALGPRFARARGAQDCVRIVVEEFGDTEREDDACVLVAAIGR
ncbi:PP2C family protein-serine/threonine phosphatase [Streptomyces sp. GC420]|uniref:PP2C family protein-serine/threonine phosphatase n=1 Tax=Streptomyces sp. GC420 TaxID=2697568 RepID=UPI0014150F48|nr:SpoIIE family protein phosphatase [Streptomyces sp. GC420]NBM17442.1 SpoIIE family protein phosphatase [Streptomyces sp. GC420]